MDARDFISSAIRLSNSQHEADLRSAVSRAYYGAFHIAHQFLTASRLQWPRNQSYAAEIHVKVRHCLSQSGNAEAIRAGELLRSLRDLRNEADYNLDSTKFRVAGRVATVIGQAIQVVDAIGRCRSEPAFSEMRAKIRGYARDVLRMPVDDA